MPISSAPPKNFQRALLVNPYGLGDVLFTTPLLRALKAELGVKHVGVILGSRTQPILARHPCVDEIFVWDKDRMHALGALGRLRYVWGLAQTVGATRWDLFLDVSHTDEYAFWARYLWKIPLRVGFRYKRRGRFLNRRIPLNGFAGRHVADHYLDLARALGVQPPSRHLEYEPSADDRHWAKEWLSRHGCWEGRRVLVMPGGGASWGPDAHWKRWDGELFAQLVRRLVRGLDPSTRATASGRGLAQDSAPQALPVGLHTRTVRVVVAGDESESALVKQVASAASCPELAGGLTVGQLAALIGHADLLVCNDGGPLHLAATQKVKTVVFFGPVDDQVYGPYPSGHWAKVLTTYPPCRPCYHHFRFHGCQYLKRCLRDISVDDALAACLEMLKA